MTKCALQTTVCSVASIPKVPTHPGIPTTPVYAEAKLEKEIGRPGKGDGEFCCPSGVVCLSSGNVVVLDSGNHRIQLFTSDLQHLSTVGGLGDEAGQFCRPTDIAIDNQDRLFITEQGNHRVQVLDQDGRHLYMFGSQGSQPGQYDNPTGIAIDKRDRVFICDWSNLRVQIVTTVGDYISTLVGPDQLISCPSCVSIGKDLVIITESFGRVHLFSGSGQYIEKMVCGQNGSNSYTELRDTVVDPWGYMLLADCYFGRVKVFNTERQVICTIGVKGRSHGQMYSPWGVTLSREGDLLITDSDWLNSKLLKYSIPTSVMMP